MRAQSRERAQPLHRLPSSPGFWKFLPLPGALVLLPHSCTLPPGGWPGWLHSLGRAYCPGLSSPATCSVSPFLQAEGDFVLRGSGTSVTVIFVHKGAGASEQSGGEGSPGPQPPALPKTPGATARVGRLFLQAQSSGV